MHLTFPRNLWLKMVEQLSLCHKVAMYAGGRFCEFAGVGSCSSDNKRSHRPHSVTLRTSYAEPASVSNGRILDANLKEFE